MPSPHLQHGCSLVLAFRGWGRRWWSPPGAWPRGGAPPAAGPASPRLLRLLRLSRAAGIMCVIVGFLRPACLAPRVVWWQTRSWTAAGAPPPKPAEPGSNLAAGGQPTGHVRRQIWPCSTGSSPQPQAWSSLCAAAQQSPAPRALACRACAAGGLARELPLFPCPCPSCAYRSSLFWAQAPPQCEVLRCALS